MSLCGSCSGPAGTKLLSFILVKEGACRSTLSSLLVQKGTGQDLQSVLALEKCRQEWEYGTGGRQVARRMTFLKGGKAEVMAEAQELLIA